MPTPRAYALVAESDPRTASSIGAAVTAATGLRCELAGDGDEGHARLATHGVPAALVTDLVLPKRDGFALIRGLRRLDPGRFVPVVAYSSFPAMRRSAESLHAELFPLKVMAKSAVPSALAAAVVAGRAASSSPAPDTQAARSAAPSSAPAAAPAPGRSVPSAGDSDALRLARIDASGVIEDAPPDAELQRITEEVARSFGVPTALVTVVLEGKP